MPAGSARQGGGSRKPAGSRSNRRKMKAPQKRADLSRPCVSSPSAREEPPSPTPPSTPGPPDANPRAATPPPEWLLSPVVPSRRQRKNYKNMTRERRVEANARERTRVHAISSAFEGLRRAVPSYSYNQRLSKLAILRIACCYILSLSRLAHVSDDDSNMSFSECVDLCTDTIQAEGRAKRRH